MILRKPAAATRDSSWVVPGDAETGRTVADAATRVLALSRRAGPTWRVAGVILCVVLAYHYSLQTLVEQMGQETPLAFLGLVPVIALLLALVLARPRPGEANIHDRYLDHIVGIPLLALAMALLMVAPRALSNLYWLQRLDLLSLPLFVAGAIALAFGTRALWRVRAAVAFLFLAWPYPYVVVLDHVVTAFTNATATAVTGVLKIIPVASVLPDGDFLIAHATGLSASFSLSVTSACSGINSGLGFLIVGGAATLLMQGRRSLKILWLAAGAATLFMVNIVRILLILAAGRAWGEHVAIDVLHPALGLVMILGTTLALLALMPRFHLGLDLTAGRRWTTGVTRESLPPLAVGRARIQLVMVVTASVAAMVANSGMARYELLAFGLGPPRLAPSSVVSAPIKAWTLTEAATYPWASRYFGPDASWARYSYIETSRPADAAPPAAITLDVISTSDLNSFAAHGLQACYGFHDYILLSNQTVHVAGGVNAKVMRYRIPGAHGAGWLALYWEWPVRSPGSELFQRVVLSVDSGITSRQPDQARLVSLARSLVRQAASQTAPADKLQF